MPGWMAASGALALAMLMLGCQSRPLPPVAMAQQVDLPRFMGDWYVIASIPTIFERDAWNAVERYQLREDGRIDTTFTFLVAANGLHQVTRPAPYPAAGGGL